MSSLGLIDHIPLCGKHCCAERGAACYYLHATMPRRAASHCYYLPIQPLLVNETAAVLT